MPFSLTCACGARLEVDDIFAGKTVQCPDCTNSLQVPTPRNPHLRTSGLALTSLVLALVGAFTVFGTLAAVGVGIMALVVMRGKEERLAGKGYAVAGIVLGVLFTGATLFTFTSTELFGLRGLLAEARWAGKLIYQEALEIERPNERFAITRPSKDWGEFKEIREASPKGEIQDRAWDDLLLVQPRQDAFILCITKLVDRGTSLGRCLDDAANEFRALDKAGLFGRKGQKQNPKKFQRGNTEPLPVDNSVEIIETVLEKTLAGQDRKFLMRAIKAQNTDVCFIVLAGTRTKNFAALEPELKKALESFRVFDVGQPR